jgi:hypothetical protein
MTPFGKQRDSGDDVGEQIVKIAMLVRQREFQYSNYLSSECTCTIKNRITIRIGVARSSRQLFNNAAPNEPTCQEQHRTTGEVSESRRKRA